VAAGPNQGFVGVAAADRTHAWAGGYLHNGDRTLLERWNGTQWQIVPTRDHIGYEGIQGVSAASSTDAVAVGYRNGHHTIRQWNGLAWSTVDVPWRRGGLNDVTATASSGTWAVGWSATSQDLVASTCG
jgi:hypothetical protein